MKAAAVVRGYAEIPAPFAGVVTEKRVEPGNLATPGAPLATIEREGAYRLEASVEESRLRDIRAGQAVSVTLDALDRTLEARVSEIVPAVDAASRSYIVKIDLPSLPGLRSGMFGRAAFDVGKRSVLAVPAAAIRRARATAFGVGGRGRYRARPAGHAGRVASGSREVLSGLSAGEKNRLPRPGRPDGRRQGGGPPVSEKPHVRHRRKDRRRLDPVQADAAVHRRLAAAGRVRGVETAARGGAADHRPDDRRVRPDARAPRPARWRSASPSRWRSCCGRSPASSTSTRLPAPGCRMAIVRFYVGQDEEKSIVRLNQKMQANFDLIPPGASPAADQAALHRRRADPGADLLEPAATTTTNCGASWPRSTMRSSKLRTSPRPPSSAARGGEIRVTLDAGQAGALLHDAHAGVRGAGCLQPQAAFGQLSPAPTASSCWRRASSCALPTTCATWWSASPTAGRSSCATSPR